MTLPSTLNTHQEWAIIGPMGPMLPEDLSKFPIIAVDGGAHFTTRIDLWVGDNDSYKKEISADHIYQHPVHKEHSDLALALGLFSGSLYYKFHLWGFLGGRKDHELFNLGECLAFLENHEECQILFYDNKGNIAFKLLGSGVWKFKHQGSFSLGTLKKTCVKLTGECDYPISSARELHPLSSLGLSNFGRGEMILDNAGPVFVYFNEEEQ